MKKKIISVLKHPLISGSTILIMGSLLANVINYLSNLVVARLLIPSDYGIFASLLSIFNIFAVFSTTISTVFTKFTAVFIGQKNEQLISALIKKGTIWVGALSFFVSGIIIIFSFQIAHFLNIKDTILVVITSLALLISLLSSVPSGVLQGLMKFVNFTLVNVFSSTFKLILIIAFLLAGFRVFGAMGAFLVATIVGYIASFVPIRKYLWRNKNLTLKIHNLYHKLSAYAFPVFLSSIGMTAMITMDIVLVKHFFSAEIAGRYSALSLMGRSIFYAVQPITFALFPLIVQKKERKEKLLGTVLLSFVLMGIPALILSLIYFNYPMLILKIFFPSEEYLSLIPYLGPFSIFILFYILSFLLNSFYISIGKIKVFSLTIGASIIEIISIVFFHRDLNQIITGLIVSSFLLLLSLLLYYPNATKTS